jgi:Galactose oxidase-like, Early set domain
VLLPDGRVLVGGNAPIANTDMFTHNWPGGFSNNYRDPSFEIYSPPYLFWGPRPTITSAPSAITAGTTFTINTSDAASISKVVLARNTALTHVIDADQRTIVLPVVSRTSSSVTVAAPPNANVAPSGPYLLFIDKTSSKGLIPSVAKQVTLDSPHPAGTVRIRFA